MISQLCGTLFFSRYLAIIAIANYLCLVICNLLSVNVGWTFAVYLTCLLCSWVAMRQLPVRASAEAPSKTMLALLGLFLLLLTLPRLVYLGEWLPANTVMLQFDDYARVAELVSMTLSEQYPLRHPSTDAWLLSFYYSSLYPMAVLKQLLPFLTLKDSVVIGSLLYHVLILGVLLEISLRSLPRHARLLFLFLCTLFGGLDWLMLTSNPWYGHDEWWAQPWFQGFYQVSSPYTSLFWTPHHYLGFLLPLVALLLFRYSGNRQPRLKHTTLVLLLLAAGYTSPFAVLPMALILLPYLPASLRRLWNNPLVWLALLSALVPAFLFMERVQVASFEWAPLQLGLASWALADQLLSASFYLIALSLIDMGGLPFLAWYLWPRMNPAQRYTLCAATAFFLSTAVLSSAGFNNYTMRGMQLVLFYYGWTVCRHLPRLNLPKTGVRLFPATIFATALVLSYPTVRESAANTRTLLLNSRLWYSAQEQQPPHYIRASYRELARDNNRRFFEPLMPMHYGLRKFNAEKLTQTPPIFLDRWEREIARYPLSPVD